MQLKVYFGIVTLFAELSPAKNVSETVDFFPEAFSAGVKGAEHVSCLIR